MNSDERRRFYEERDRRSRILGAAPDRLEKPIGIVVGEDAAASLPGQVAALALANMIARVHRRGFILVPEVPLQVSSISGTPTNLREAVINTLRTANPCFEYALGDPPQNCHSVALGKSSGASTTLRIGYRNCTAIVSKCEAPLEGSGRPAMLGAALAACLGAAELFKLVHGEKPTEAALSAWEFEEIHDPTGPPELPEVDVGDVAIIGAGAVASAVGYWVSHFGHSGHWAVVDRDVAKLHNTARSLGIMPWQAGWPSGIRLNKAEILAPVIGAEPYPCWYDEWELNDRYDLIVPLANERGVRSAINQFARPILLHATTSVIWQSQLHRHIVGIDDCIDCRLPPTARAEFKCSEGALPQVPLDATKHTDAALPFLSAAAGLLFVAGLYRLMAGNLGKPFQNWWAVDFRRAPRFLRGHNKCKANCGANPGVPLARRVSNGQRWVELLPP